MGNYYICCGTMWIPVDNGTVPCPPQPPATSCDGATTGQECVIQNQTCPVGTPPHLCRCDSLSMINTYTSTGTPGASPTGNRCCGGWWILGEQTPCPPPPPVGEYMLPFHVNFSATSGECMNAPESERFSHSSSLASQTKRFLPSCALCFALVCLRQWTSRRMWACGTTAQWTAGTRRASPATA
jgi:hypothetical protein